MGCESCNKDKEAKSVPFIVHESAMSRNERSVKRLVFALVVAIAMIFASNALWLWAWSQYDYESERTVVEALDGVANYIGNDGDILNGADYGN